MSAAYDIVIPTIGRDSLRVLLGAIAHVAPAPEQLVLVDDRPRVLPLALPDAAQLQGRIIVLHSRSAGPAAARNLGWRAARSPWVVFLDDDVLITSMWGAALQRDLAAADSASAVQGRVLAPFPQGRRPTDWERSVHALEDALWITADLAVRRTALEDVGGFDERFPRAFREDADLALRLHQRGHQLRKGTRITLHPVPPSSRWVSVRRQRGNCDDVLMEALHGRRWYDAAGAPRGAIRSHEVTTTAAVTALAATALRRHRIAAATAGIASLGWARFAWSRIAPGPRSRDEIATMLVTSLLIPPLATMHRIRGHLRVRRLRRDGLPWQPQRGLVPDVAAVLFDRDGTLTHDVPYNGQPALVRPVAGAARAVRRLRDRGVRVAVVSNQSGVARGLIDAHQVEAVNGRVDELVGPLDAYLCCFHGETDGCDCRKPAPGLVLEAAQRLGVPVDRCVVIGDTGADVEAAERAGATGVLVPNPRTRRAEVRRAAHVATDLESAVDLVLGAAR